MLVYWFITINRAGQPAEVGPMLAQLSTVQSSLAKAKQNFHSRSVLSMCEIFLFFSFAFSHSTN